MAGEASISGEVTETIYPEEGILPDNEELFAGYIDQTFFGNRGISLLSSTHHGVALGTAMEKVYESLRTKIAAVADGSTSSTAITMYGLSIDLGAAGMEEMKSKFSDTMALLLDCILADCPYELYWFDKTKGFNYNYSYNASYKITSITVRFSVASAYAGDTRYTTDTAKTQAASLVAANAKTIVERHTDKSDYNKLLAYYQEICDLTSYNFTAIEDETTPYGDPWQLIYVFDNDPDTKVVCEGYSKAFQYLCELSEFDEEVYCYTILGEMAAAGNSQFHMWNHISIDGGNYMADITNSDEEAIGAGGKLFLKGMEGNISAGYSKTIHSVGITYTYDQDSLAMFGDDSESILLLSSKDYAEPSIYKVTGAVEEEELTWGPQQTTSLSCSVKLAPDAAQPVSYQWYRVISSGGSIVKEIQQGATESTYITEAGLDSGRHTYCVQVTQGEWKKECEISFWLAPLTLTADDLEFSEDMITKSYDATTASDAKVQIKAGVVAEEAVEIAGTANYDSADVKNATKVIFTPNDITSGNYTLASTEIIEHTAGITKRMKAEAPLAPKAEDITDDTIVLQETKDCEYSFDGINWQSERKFEGLKVNTTYSFYQRIAESENTVVSRASTGAQITTAKRNVAKLDIELSVPENGYIYDGTEKKPEIQIKENGNAVAAELFEVEYLDNTNAGTAVAVITAVEDGQYCGETTKLFEIVPKRVEILVQGSTSKLYDGTDRCDGKGLTLSLDGLCEMDEITVTADFAYEDAGVGSDKNIIVSNMLLSGPGAENYVPATPQLTVKLGEILGLPTPSPDIAATTSPVPEESQLPEKTVEPGEKDMPPTTPKPKYTAVAATTKKPASEKKKKVVISTNTTQIKESLLEQGTYVKDAKTNGIYRITQNTDTQKTLLFCSPLKKNSGIVTIPASLILGGDKYKVTGIKAKAFANCKSLRIVTIGKSVSFIRKKAFKGCKNMKIIKIKTKKLTRKNIGKKAFKGVGAEAVIRVPGKKYKEYKKLLRLRGAKKRIQIKK